MLRLGILSDTHGQLRPRVLDLLEGSELILHAGDVGDPAILDQLAEIAPVEAVRGNVDGGDLADLPTTFERELGGITVGMVHRRDDVPVAWRRSVSLVVFGHSHRPELEWHGRALWLNPGAVGPRRFSLPLTLARVVLDGDRIHPEILSVAD